MLPKPITVVVSCWLGNHTFSKPITVVVLFEEPINELGQIPSHFDDIETNFSAPCHLFWFSETFIFSTGLCSQSNDIQSSK